MVVLLLRNTLIAVTLAHRKKVVPWLQARHDHVIMVASAYASLDTLDLFTFR